MVNAECYFRRPLRPIETEETMNRISWKKLEAVLLTAMTCLCAVTVSAEEPELPEEQPELTETEHREIEAVAVPDPSQIRTEPGTAAEELDLPDTLSVLFAGSETPEEQGVIWQCSTYDADTEGSYIFQSEFTDTSLAWDDMPAMTVIVEKYLTITGYLEQLPESSSVFQMSDEEKNGVRSLLQLIRSIENEMTEEDRTAWQSRVPEKYALYQELCTILLDQSGGEHDYLDDDLIYVETLSVSEMKDGIGPFDEEDTAGKDTSDSNRRIRTFDTLTYTLFYRTRSYGIYDSVGSGYMFYEFILPCTEKEAVFDTESMGWAGNGCSDLDALAPGTTGWTLSTDGEGNQVLLVKRFMEPNETAENAFPGSGTVSAVIHILGASNGKVIQPVFRTWMDHNDMERAAECISEQVEVTCELRMNAALAKHTHTQGLDVFDFSTGNDLALNKDAGQVKGRIYGYSVNLQLYSKGSAGTGADLKGCALPEGPISVSVDMQAVFRRSSASSAPVSMNDDGFVPLIWSYEGNKRPYSDLQTDARDVKSYGLTYATLAPLNRKNERPDIMPADGSNGCWNGGDWTAVQEGSVVTFTIYPKSDEHPGGYEVNPRWFPNGNSGAAPKNQNIYWKPSDGVFTARVGCISAAEVYFIVPFEQNGTGLSEWYEDTGTVELSAADAQLKVDGVLLEQGNSSDDVLTWSEFIAGGGVYTPNIHYASADGYGDINHNEEPDSFLHTGEDAVAAGQPMGITWGLWCDPRGDSDNTVYAVNSLMKFDDEGILLQNSDGAQSSPSVYQDGYYASGSYSWMYAAKPDGTGWNNDAEMNAAVESDLIYFSDLQQLRDQGFTCVGILTQYRKDLSEKEFTKKAILSYIPCTSGEETAGNVYQIRISTTWWLKDRVSAAGGMIPLRPEGTDNLTFVLPQGDKQNVKEDYVKAVWENSAYVSGHTGDNHDGDSVYVTPFRSEVEITAAQIQAGSEEPARIYSLDSGQRYVEYRIRPSLTTYTQTGEGTPVTVTVKAVLPPQLMYNSDFGSWYASGAQYIQAGIGKQGSCSGQPLEPALTSGENGQTVLTWTLENIIPSQNMDNIYFGTVIDEENGYIEVTDQQQIIVKAVISADGDHRPLTPANDNISEAGIRISKQLAMAVSKRADRRFIDPNESAEWTVTAGNNGSSDLTDSVVLDVFASDSTYTGDLLLDEFRILKYSADGTKVTAENLNDWEIWYTYQEINETEAENITAGQIRSSSGWIRGTVQNDGEDRFLVLDQAARKNIKAAAVVGTLYRQQTCRLHISVAMPGSQGGQKVRNTVYRGSDTGESTVYIVSRSIEGIVWNDGDLDGQRSVQEQPMHDMTITLLKQNTAGNYEPYAADGVPAVIHSSQSMDVHTGTVSAYTDGRYRFMSLPEGTYRILIEADCLPEYLLSPLHIGSTETDSDGVGIYEEGKLSGIGISGIVMPEASSIGSYRYASENNDAGMAPAHQPLVIRKIWIKEAQTALPEEITIKLYADGELLETYTLTKTDAVSGTDIWQITTAALPVYRQDGSDRIQYTVSESAVSGCRRDMLGGRTVFALTGEAVSEPGLWIAESRLSGDCLEVINTWDPAEEEQTGTFEMTLRKCSTEHSLINEPAVFELFRSGVSLGQYTTEAGSVMIGSLEEGSYVLREVTAPAGYVRSDADISFEILQDGTLYLRDELTENGIIRFLRKLFRLETQEHGCAEWDAEERTMTVINERIKGSLKITKHTEDIEGDPIATEQNYRFALHTADGDLIRTFEVKNGQSTVLNDIPYGIYILTELNGTEDSLSPAYVFRRFAVTGDPAVKVNGEIVELTVTNIYERRKKDMPVEKIWDGAELPEAEFVLYADGKDAGHLSVNAESSWKGVFEGLNEYDDAGRPISYEIKEVVPPGYAVTADETGSVFTNHQISLFVLKTDEKGNALPGAQLSLRDSHGNEVYSWTSSEVREELGSKLKASESYSITEIKIPDGYASHGTAIEFSVLQDGTVISDADLSGHVLKIENVPLDIRVEKLDSFTKKPLSGAVLKIIDETGKVIDRWTSTEEAHRLQSVSAGKTYTLIEEKAPDQYQISAPITFTAASSDQTQIITMYDKKKSEFLTALPKTGGDGYPVFWLGVFLASGALFAMSAKALMKR